MKSFSFHNRFLLILTVILLTGCISTGNLSTDGNSEILKDAKRTWRNIKQPGVERIGSINDTLSESQLATGDLYRVSDSSVNVGYIYKGRVKSCRAGGCVVGASGVDNINGGGYEYFIFRISLDTALVIKRIVITDYYATHGDEVCNRFWLKQFVGHNGDEKLVYGDNISAISGATVSGRGLVNRVDQLLNFLKEMKAKGLI